jgi:hypothetical protein
MQAPYFIVICGLPGSSFFHIISQTVRFLGKKVIENKTCVLIFSTNFFRNASHPKKNLPGYDHKCTEVIM